MQLKYVLVLFLIINLLACNIKSQNLINNPSFEQYYIEHLNFPCPGQPCCSIARPSLWRYTNGHAWWPWNPNAVHYFNADMNFCFDDEFPIPYQGVPIHSWNSHYFTLNGYYYQEAKDGNAFIILLTYTLQSYGV